MKKLLLTGLTALILLSCSEADLNETDKIVNTGIQTKSRKENDNYLLKKKFAIALHKAMVDHIEIREFIKTEALKQFNKDYDVLYGYIKDEKTGGSNTFRTTLLNYFNSEEELIEIENELPSLTIFVPTLPKNSFSAELWDTSKDVPLVGLRLLDNESTPIISSNSDSFLLDGGSVPGFPVVVVKENERVMLPFNELYERNKTAEYISTTGFRFKFSADYYDNFIPKGGPAPIDENENRVLTAWEENKNKPDSEKMWHRDYVYFNINENNPNGPLIRNYQERYTNFKIEGSTPLNALKNITDPSPIANNNLADPSLKTGLVQASNVSAGSFWTDGKFDFYMTIAFKKDSNPADREFDLAPEQLFAIEYTAVIAPLKIYHVTSISQLSVSLLDRVDGKLWELDIHDNEWDINIIEKDLEFEQTRSFSKSSKRNTNFSIEGSFGEKYKLGAKFGITSEVSETSTQTIKWTTKSNDLQSVSVHFGDNIIISQHQGGLFNNHTIYSYRKYSSGKFSISSVPKKVQ